MFILWVAFIFMFTQCFWYSFLSVLVLYILQKYWHLTVGFSWLIYLARDCRGALFPGCLIPTDFCWTQFYSPLPGCVLLYSWYIIPDLGLFLDNSTCLFSKYFYSASVTVVRCPLYALLYNLQGDLLPPSSGPYIMALGFCCLTQFPWFEFSVQLFWALHIFHSNFRAHTYTVDVMLHYYEYFLQF